MTDSGFAQMNAMRTGTPNPVIVALEARLHAAQLAHESPGLNSQRRQLTTHELLA